MKDEQKRPSWGPTSGSVQLNRILEHEDRWMTPWGVVVLILGVIGSYFLPMCYWPPHL